MNEECLICGAPLEYLQEETLMECFFCHKKVRSLTRCVKGHYVCDECHSAGMDAMVSVCLKERSKDPGDIMEKLMSQKFCHMHGPEHHSMVGAALLTAYRNAGGEVDLEKRLMAMLQRGKQIPGGVCGFWGACGAGLSTGMFVSIISKSTPLTNEPYALSHRMTAKALTRIAEVGGPRCCKRNSWLAMECAVEFVRDELGIGMEMPEIVCKYIPENAQCIGKRCPYAPANHKA